MSECEGNGECINQCAHKGHNGYCPSNCCQLVECANYNVCHTKHPEWLLNCHNSMCVNCAIEDYNERITQQQQQNQIRIRNGLENLDTYTPEQLRPFQRRVWEMTQMEPDNNTINWVYDTGELIGKNQLVRFLYKYTENVMDIDYGFMTKSQIKKCIKSQHKKGWDMMNTWTLFMEIHRSVQERKFDYELLKEIKDGRLVLDRKMTTITFNHPNVWIFSRFLPNVEKFENYNLVIWEVNEGFELVPH